MRRGGGHRAECRPDLVHTVAPHLPQSTHPHGVVRFAQCGAPEEMSGVLHSGQFGVAAIRSTSPLIRRR